MHLGRTLHELWHLRIGLAVSVALAVAAAAWGVQRDVGTAAVTTTALVDTPRSTAADVSLSAGDILAGTNRALLIANLMAGAPVRAAIAQRVGVPAAAIRVSSPLTPDWPRPLAGPGRQRAVTDILEPPTEYRLSVRSNPTVPEIDVYATAPTLAAATRLADGAIAATQSHLRALGAAQDVKPSEQVVLRQLGGPEGGMIGGEANVQLAALAFLVTLLASAATVLFLARVRRGWALPAPAAAAGPGA